MLNFSQFLSAYRKRHSTEAALLEVLDGICTAADDKQVIRLDFSAALLDTVSHETSADRLCSEGNAAGMDPMLSCLEDWTQLLKLGTDRSPGVSVNVGVPAATQNTVQIRLYCFVLLLFVVFYSNAFCFVCCKFCILFSVILASGLYDANKSESESEI